jgi:lipopolysaccharide export system permease protein
VKVWRRHDGYVLRSFLGAFGLALLFLTSVAVLWDLADRIAKIQTAAAAIKAAGETPVVVVLEYYATLIPFVWLRILPIAAMIAGSLCVVWLCRHNELQPLVAAGVPVRRALRPIFLAAVVLALAQVAVREWVVPSLAKRNDYLQRVISEPRPNRIERVPHVHDPTGGRLSAAVYVPVERRLEGVWVTFLSGDPAAEDRRPVAYRYPSVAWSDERHAWVADRGGERILLDSADPGAETRVLPVGTAARLGVDPTLLELTLRQSAALGLSSGEIQELARSNPGNARLALTLQQQVTGPVSTIVLMLLGLPFAVRLGKRGVSRAALKSLAVVALFFFCDSVSSDLGARGTLQPVAAAWIPTVVFGALGLALMADVES